MKITKAEDGTFAITGITPDELERLMYMVKAAKCGYCENLYKCGEDGKCSVWILPVQDAVQQHWIDTAETEAERNYLRERFYGKAKQD